MPGQVTACNNNQSESTREEVGVNGSNQSASKIEAVGVNGNHSESPREEAGANGNRSTSLRGGAGARGSQWIKRKEEVGVKEEAGAKGEVVVIGARKKFSREEVGTRMWTNFRGHSFKSEFLPD